MAEEDRQRSKLELIKLTTLLNISPQFAYVIRKKGYLPLHLAILAHVRSDGDYKCYDVCEDKYKKILKKLLTEVK